MFFCNRILHHLRLQVMGLTKQYLRYVASAVFGVIGSQKANIAYVTLRGGERGRYVAVAACEHVFIWDVRKGEKVRLRGGQQWRTDPGFPTVNVCDNFINSSHY